MTTADKTVDKASEATNDSGPPEALKDAGQKLIGLLVQSAAQMASDRVAGLTDRLDDVTETGNVGGLLGGNDGDDEDGADGGGLGSKLKSGLGDVKDKVKETLGGGGGGGGGGKKLKVTNIAESIDVGLPLQTTYNVWTQFADFPSFMKKVESVEQASDEKTNWKAQVFLSHRTWEATTVEQVPDSHIVWRSKGEKGHVDGAVTFTEIGPSLTRVLLVLEYWPQGLFERTGNLWRAQGRRARLELKHFRRHAMVNVLLNQDEVEGWRGEIRDSEVVKTHEEALEEEQAESDDEEPEDEEQDSAEDQEAEDEESEPDASDEDEDAEDDYADEEAAEEDDESAEADEDYADEEDDEDYEDEDEYADEEDWDEEEAPAEERVPARSGSRG